MLVSALAFHSWQAPHAQEKCIRKAKAARVPNVRNLLIFSGIAIRKTFHRSRCQPGTAVFAVACPFFGTKESGAREIVSELSGVKGAVRSAYAEPRAIPSL